MKKQTKNLPSIMSARGVSDESGLEQYIRSIQKFPVLSAAQEYEYASKWVKTHDASVAEKLISAHLRLVVKVAYDFKNYGIPVADLIASGNMGLMQAVQKFDPERGFRFSTYAMFWIRAEMYETILSNWSVVKIGASANQKRVFFNLARAKRALGIADSNLSDAQIKQIADHLDVGENDVARMATRMGRRDLSLNAPAGSDADAPEMLANMADEAPGIEDTIERSQFRRRGFDMLRKHLGALPERDRDILYARRLAQPALTLEVLANKYGISRERVRQIEEKAFAKLRAAILKESA